MPDRAIWQKGKKDGRKKNGIQAEYLHGVTQFKAAAKPLCYYISRSFLSSFYQEFCFLWEGVKGFHHRRRE